MVPSDRSYRIEPNDGDGHFPAVCPSQENECVGQVGRVTDNQVDAVVELGRRFYRKREVREKGTFSTLALNASWC